MSRSVHRFAERDLVEAVRFYRQEAGAGVARRFVEEFERVARLVEEFPAIGTPTRDQRRSFPLAGYPYSIIYRPDGTGIRILVVRHQNRDPSHGDARL